MQEVPPLDGVTILDLTRLLPGPYATQLLGDAGADVIKIEQPGVGDYMRAEEPQLKDGNSHEFATLNRNKHSVAINLKDERGHEIFLELVEEADAVVESFRPGVVDRLGIDYETVRERNDSVVYCSLSGFGQESPYKEWVGHDINYIGIGGLLDLTGETDGPPQLPGLPVADFGAAMMTAYSVMVGLFRAATTGKGEYFDISMTDVLISWMSIESDRGLHPEGEPATRGETQPSGKYPCYDVYETADGRYITLGAFEFHFWEAACDVLGLEEFANEDDHLPDGARADEIRAVVADRFAEQTLEDWMDAFDPTVVPVAPVNTVDQVWEDEQTVQRNLVRRLEKKGEEFSIVDSPFKTARSFETVREPHPDLGEDSRQILSNAGIPDRLVEELVADDVIQDAG